MIETKQVVTVKNEYEGRDISTLIAHIGFYGYWNFGARIRICKKFFNECSYKNVKFSFGTSMREVKPVNLEKHELDYRDESSLVAIFGSFKFI